MLPLVALALALVVGVVVLEAVSYRALERIPSVATEEFPRSIESYWGSSAVSIPNSGGSHSPTGRNRRTRAITSPARSSAAS